MPIRIPPTRPQAWCRPSTIILSRAPLVRPPRTRTQQPSPLPAVYLRKMSSSTVSPGTTTAPGSSSGPAPAASTSPRPGSSPSHMSAAAGAGAGGATPAAATASTAPTAAAHNQPPPTVEIENEDQGNNNTSKNGSDGAIPTSSSSSPSTSESSSAVLPALPAPEDATSNGAEGKNGLRTVVVNGQAVALDNLGPMVVGRDGTVSRIANWAEMSEIERQNTLRILGKRNQLRLANLRAGLPADQKPAAAAAAAAAADS
ncbi:uncharacterized protein B0T15DRAFT_535234 [Chaetomium strumarium]|uniref:Uncharacterized protein n=1 Tax=Chaetomium strumarium TaxID=1170767 RepID=A0AAJ0M019_9PEZI|nr:hypothetical protein B0T15DRAFT_535234 [Chaetomium strumarium]